MGLLESKPYRIVQMCSIMQSWLASSAEVPETQTVLQNSDWQLVQKLQRLHHPVSHAPQVLTLQVVDRKPFLICLTGCNIGLQY